jgi:hypothetical protein
MKTFFIPKQDVLHPETNEPIFSKGRAYSQILVDWKMTAYGVDHLDTYVIYAPTLLEALDIFEKIDLVLYRETA